MTQDATQAAGFLEALTGETDPQTLFATFPDRGKDGPARHFFGRLSELWPVLVGENNAGRGVFFTVNRTRGDSRKAEDIVSVRAVFIDNDSGFSPEPNACHRPPSIMVNSGRGRHTYWLLREGQDIAQFSGVQRRLAVHYKTDPAVSDLPRVMRLPGFLHMKAEPRPVTWYDVDPGGGAFYSLDDMAAGLPLDPKASEGRKGPVGYALPAAGSRRLTSADVAKLSRGKVPDWAEGPLEAIHKGNAPTLDPARFAGQVDVTITRFLAWFVGKFPDCSADSIVDVMAPSWTLLTAADSAAGRSVYTLDDLARKVANAIRYIHESRAEEIESNPFLDLVARDAEGYIIPSRSNLEIVFRHHPRWKGVLGFDERFRRYVYRKSAPWIGASWAPLGGGTDGPPGSEGQTIADQHTGLFASWFASAEHLHLTRLTTTCVVEAVEAVAFENRFDPFKEWLEIQEWDGVPRLVDWLHTYLGADKNEWTRSVGPRWLMAAVARTLYPGCKADEMLVLEGKQGIRKSSALRALAGAEYFTDSLPRGGDPTDQATALCGPVILEIPELDGLSRRKEASEIKAFLSKQTDRYRPKYGRREIEVPRRVVFAGTTNETDYLVDLTGGRRFWPVAVGVTFPLLDVDGLARDRGQLWAEARTMVQIGLPWHLSREESEEAAAAVSERTEADPWEALVARYVAGMPEARTLAALEASGAATGPLEAKAKEWVTVDEILTKALDLPRGKWSTHDARRASHCLRKAGYTRKKSHGQIKWFRIGGG